MTGLRTPHALPPDEVARSFDVAPALGLSSWEAAQRLARHGPNRLRRQKPKSILAILLHQFGSVIVWLLAVAAALSLALGDTAEAVAIGVVLLLNSAIGVFTELRAVRSMEALLRMAEVRTRVRRDGRDQMVDARDLVPGDVIILEGGDVVTADLRLTEESRLEADESVLTGEAAPVAKASAPVAADTLLAERSPMVFKGTAITQGSGEAIVVATGMETELGRISRLTEEAGDKASPLEVRLDRLGHALIWLTLGLTAAMVAAGIWRGYVAAEMVQTGVALAVAAIPEGLPVIATLSLARGMLRMARRNALIRRLSAVETLGATTMILTDKTGTLTENRMTVVRYLLDGGDAAPSEGGTLLATALRTGALCTTAGLGLDGEEGTGDPMELALLKASRAAGQDLPDGPAGRLAHHAFDHRRRLMAVVHEDPDGAFYAVKGAPEAVIAVCGAVLGPEGPRPLDVEEKADWSRRNAAVAGLGLRTLGLAMKTAARADEDPYEGLTLVGLACFADPLRADVPPAIAACREAGVRVVMATGDHAETAARIARDAGIRGDGSEVIEGAELVDFDPAAAAPALVERLRRADVFARVAPETKLSLVEFYQREGHVVAMTGDGVNDAPALKRADIGVAMGQRGTQVARDAADMVLKDDDFATIVEAVRQGRVIFGNIRKFIVYLMSCNLCEVLVVALAVTAGLPTPLLPLQILFLNLVTDVFPAFALGLGQGDGREMQRPPRDPAEPIVGRDEWIRIVSLGAILTLATLGAFTLALYRLALPVDQSVTVAFLTLALSQLWNVFNVCGPGSHPIFNEVTRNPFVWGALALCVGLIAAALWLPVLSTVLQLTVPGLSGLALAAGMSVVPLVLGQILRF